MQLGAQKIFLVVNTKIEMDWHTDTCLVGDQCLVINHNNRPENVFGFDPKQDQSMLHPIEIEGPWSSPHLSHVVPHAWCYDSWCSQAPNTYPIKITHTIKIMNPFNVTHPIIMSLQLNRVTSYINVRKPTLEEYEDQNILMIELTG